MIEATTTSLIKLLLQAWKDGAWKVRIALSVAFFLGLSLAVGAAMAPSMGIQKKSTDVLIGVIGFAIFLIVAGVAAYQSLVEDRARSRKIETVEERAREHPDQPQFAWDLARTKLESYLDRNLSQVRSIFWLTLTVMLCGFAFVMYGLFQASQDPTRLPVSVIAAVSGVIISFIGGSFLLVFRAILSESRGYVSVLERINAVGMAVQVIANIPESSAELKHATTANLAAQLLNLYARSPAEPGAPPAADKTAIS